MTNISNRQNEFHLANDMSATFGSAPAAVLNVGPDETYATIAAAMAVANAGDQILLEAGYGNEDALVTVNNLFVNGTSSSMHVDLTLGAGIDTVTLLGSAPIDVFDNGGNDTITGNAGANLIEVTGGVDVAHGGGGTDRLFVDYSNATLSVIGTAVNVSDGGTHAVTFDGFENFTIYTGSGADSITAGNGANVIHTNGGNDTVTTGNGSSQVVGGAGNDTITAGDGGNDLWGGSGNDTITAGAGADSLNGGVGDDTLSGGGGNDMLDGSTGNDTISGGLGNDTLMGGTGNNTLDGGADTDTADYSLSTKAVTVNLGLSSAQAVNSLETDTLTSIENVTGSAFRDTLMGSAGDNVLNGGLGADHMNGGGGSDTFVYALAAESTSKNYDTISDFRPSNDTIDFGFQVNALDAKISDGHLSTMTFDADMAAAVGAGQLGIHDAVIFTPTTGSLAGLTFVIVDANGVAGYQAGEDFVIQFDSSTPIHASDFI